MRIRPTLALVLAATLLLAACVPLPPLPPGLGGGSSTATGSGSATAPPVNTTPPLTSSTPSPFVAPGAAVSRVVVSVGIEGRVPGVQGLQDIGNGSGIIIRPDGYILTNQHVAGAGTGITATIGSETVPAKVVGQDPSTDLAVIKVDKTGLPSAAIGDPKKLQVGEYVVAVGYPFGVGATVTHGIVSALGRSTLAPQDQPNPHGGSAAASSAVAAYTDLIQTDAAINPGNSGGALATLDGAVIGVNTLIESPSGVSSGIGFAIPIDFAMKVADQLIKTGKAVHPYLSIMISSLPPGSTAASEGVLVRQVLPGGAAARAGLHPDDVIVSIGGMPVADVEGLYAALRQQEIGATVPVEVIRGGKKQTIQVTIGSDKPK